MSSPSFYDAMASDNAGFEGSTPWAHDPRTIDFVPPVVLRYCDGVGKNDRRGIYDLGAGEGWTSTQLLERTGRTVVAIDFSAGMLQGATARGLPAVRADGANLPFADDSGILVAARYSVPYMDQRVLAECKRVAPYLGMAQFEPYDTEEFEFFNELNPYTAPGLQRFLPRGQNRAFLRNAGAQILRGIEFVTLHNYETRLAALDDPDDAVRARKIIGTASPRLRERLAINPRAGTMSRRWVALGARWVGDPRSVEIARQVECAAVGKPRR